MTVVTIILISLVLGIGYLIYRNRKKYNLPPGPAGVPIFGNAFQFDLGRFATQIASLGNQYDDAFTIKFLNKKIVILNSFSMIKEAMESPKYAEIVSGRPRTFIAEYYIPCDLSFSTYSKEWVALRKMVFRGLKTYGTHLREVEMLARQELSSTISRIREQAGSAVDPYDYITGYVTSILVMLLTGTHLEYNAPLIRLCSDVIQRGEALVHPATLIIMTTFPWLRWLPFGCWKNYQILQQQTNILTATLFENRKIAEQSTCFLDYMMEQKEKGHVDTTVISSVFVDLLVAGTSTTRTTVCSALLILAHKPDIQERIQKEIDTEIGIDRLPSIEDKQRMPYTQAVLEECFRLYCAAPLSLPHVLIDDLEIRNYKIPNDTQMFYNIWNVLHDPDFWQNPYNFNPDRFLDDDGNYVSPENEKRQRTFTFGLGKRMCMGENITRVRLFLLLVAVLQNFNIKPHKDYPLPDPDPRKFSVNIVLHCPRYKVILETSRYG